MSLTPPRPPHCAPLYPSNWLSSVLYLIDPCAAFPFSLLFPTGITKEVLESITAFCPEYGWKTKSLVSDDIVFPDKRIWLLTTKSVNPNGSIRTSEISSNVREETAVTKKVSVKSPFVVAPELWIGEFPVEAVKLTAPAPVFATAVTS